MVNRKIVITAFFWGEAVANVVWIENELLDFLDDLVYHETLTHDEAQTAYEILRVEASDYV